MTSPTKEGSDPTDNALENSENEAPNTDTEPSSAESNMISQVESTPINRELDLPTSQEHAAPQEAENNKLEAEKNQGDPQEAVKQEESLLIQIPIPRKWIFLMSGLGRITPLNTLVKTDGKKPLNNRARFCSGNMGKPSNLCYSTINSKIPYLFSISWRRPFISRHVLRSMTLRLLCRRYFSQAAGHRNITWVKQQYVAFVTNPNVHPHRGRARIFRRPSRIFCYCHLLERIILNRMSESTYTEGKRNFHNFVRSVHDIPRAHFENEFNRRVFESYLRSHHNMRVVIRNTSDGWQFLCPICGSSFNTFVEFRQHSCNSPGN